MKVLMLHASYSQPGGEDLSTQYEAELLDLYDVQVELLNISSPANPIDCSRSLRVARQAIQQQKFDIIHVQNFFPTIGPSFYQLAKRQGMGVVQAIRNYRLTCIAGTHFRAGAPCNLCTHQSAKQGILHGCYRQGRSQSLIAAATMARHRSAGTWAEGVDVFLAVSEHVADFALRPHVDDSRIVIKPNFEWESRPGTGIAGNAVCVGRITPEKGVAQLVLDWQACKELPSLVIVGEGPDRSEVERLAASDERIKVVGQLPHEESLRLMANASVVVAPWLWDEPFGRVIGESLSVGTPVIATDRPGCRAVLGVGSHAAYYTAGRPSSLVAAQRAAAGNRAAAHARFRDAFTAERNISLITEAYDRALRLGQ